MNVFLGTITSVGLNGWLYVMVNGYLERINEFVTQIIALSPSIQINQERNISGGALTGGTSRHDTPPEDKNS